MRNTESKEKESNAPYTVLPAVLDEMIKYIENTEETIDGEWGYARHVKQLIKDKCMAELYDKLLTIKNGR